MLFKQKFSKIGPASRTMCIANRRRTLCPVHTTRRDSTRQFRGVNWPSDAPCFRQLPATGSSDNVLKADVNGQLIRTCRRPVYTCCLCRAVNKPAVNAELLPQTRSKRVSTVGLQLSATGNATASGLKRWNKLMQFIVFNKKISKNHKMEQVTAH